MTYTGTVITWGSVASTSVPGLYVQKVDRNLFGEVMDEEDQLPGRDGAWVYGDDARGMKPIPVQLQIVQAISDRRAATSDLARWLNLSGMQNLAFSDEPDRYWRAYLPKAPPANEWRNQSKVVLEWRAEPYAYSVSTSSQCVTATGGEDSDQFMVSDDLPACPVIEITPLNGYVDGYTLTVNDYELIVQTVINQGNTQTVSGCSYTITGGLNAEAELNGAYSPSPLWTVDARGEFPLLEAGLNDWGFSWDGSATNVRICFYWRERLY